MASTGPISMIWPRYMTQMNSEKKRTTLKSWEMNIKVVSNSAFTLSKKFIIAASTATSKAVVGNGALAGSARIPWAGVRVCVLSQICRYAP